MVLAGYAVDVRVDRGALVLRDGLGQRRRERRIYRADNAINRIVVASSTGGITLSALRWCTDVGIPLTVLDPDGWRVLSLTAPPAHDDARLRRAQAIVGNSEVGLQVARDLIDAKLIGQADTVRDIYGHATAVEAIGRHREQLAAAESLADILHIEANAASAYFRAWAGIRVPFAKVDAAKVPPSWLTFSGRTSILTDGHEPRRATDPLNAIANYLYRLAEVEATLACQTMGLDPGMGVLHRDMKGRDSLALDLIEPVRPQVDRYLLDLLDSHTFTRRDFIETRDGQCRLMPSLTEELSGSMPLWAQAVAPIAESVAHAFVDSMPGVARRRSPLTGKTKTSPRRPRELAPRGARKLDARCPDCGGQLGDSRRLRCPECFENDRLRVASERVTTAEALVRRLAAAGADSPAEKRALSAAKNGLVRYLNALWELENPTAVTDREVYRREVLPLIAAIPVPLIRERLQVGNDSAWRMRSGDLTPHPRHWSALRELASAP